MQETLHLFIFLLLLVGLLEDTTFSSIPFCKKAFLSSITLLQLHEKSNRCLIMAKAFLKS